MTRIALFVLFLFGASLLSAQSLTRLEGKSLAELRYEDWQQRLLARRGFLRTPLLTNPESNYRSTVQARQAAPRVYQYEELAFFCRLEVKLEEAAGLPVRFRLGSVDYVDYLEGKRRRY